MVPEIPIIVRDELEKAYAAVMSFPEGIRVLRHILEITGYSSDEIKTYDPSTSELNANATIYNLSKRDVWLEVKKFITPKQQCVLEETPIINIEYTEESEDYYDA